MTKQIRKLKNKHINFYRSKTGNLCYVVEHDDGINLKTIYNHTFQVKVVTDNNYRCRVPKFSFSIHDTGNLNYRRYKKTLNTMYQPDFDNPLTDAEKEEVLLGYKLFEEKELLKLCELQRRSRIHMIGGGGDSGKVDEHSLILALEKRKSLKYATHYNPTEPPKIGSPLMRLTHYINRFK